MRDSKTVSAAVFLLAVIGAQALPLELDLPQQNEFFNTNFTETVLFDFYSRASGVNNPIRLTTGDRAALKSAGFDKNKNTIVVIHGYLNKVTSKMPQTVKDAVLQFQDANVICVDWNYFTRNPNYFWVVSEMLPVGEFIGDFITFLANEGLTEDRMHIIGHSLGAHVSGFAGKRLQANGLIPARISGLDPAAPDIMYKSAWKRLSSTDARFVDCIHTCGGLLGMAEAICQVDFYPNGGINVQPGCHFFDAGKCSHGRSYQFFAESVDPTHHFSGQKCHSVVVGVPYNCGGELADMGYYVPPKTRGIYYLTTASSPPFALDIDS
ncbi:Lipase [Nesidiocoris tenuis]|uniref:Lipase n=1 Tax=Nesidiocoris tenuis TaxID=355587 RepID=A0ABN7A6T4_9HEMI|nr:Lipase [Nesidiocoris tenuis]